MNKKRIRPLSDNILIDVDEVGDEDELHEGTIVRLGPDVSPLFKEGQRVLFDSYKSIVDTCLEITAEHMIVAVIEEPNNGK